MGELVEKCIAVILGTREFGNILPAAMFLDEFRIGSRRQRWCLKIPKRTPIDVKRVAVCWVPGNLEIGEHSSLFLNVFRIGIRRQSTKT